MKVICENCKNEIEVEPYIYNSMARTIETPVLCKSICVLSVNVKIFCPLCGTLHDYKGIEKELSDVEICSMVKQVVPHYINARQIGEQQNER